MMADARQIIPGTTYFLTRRCSERRYFLRPDGFIVRAFLFILGCALQRYNVSLVACCVMGNHWHAVVVDWDGKLPRFTAMVHRLVAKCTNVFRNRWEAMWASSSYSAIPLHTADDVIDKIVYTLANPVRAGLVAKVEEWPGLLLGPQNGLTIVHQAAKPNRFFRKKSRTIPGATSIQLVKPPPLDHVSEEDYVAWVAGRLSHRVDEVAVELENEDRVVLGAEAVLEVDPNSAPSSWEPKRTLDPKIIARDTALRIQLIAIRQAFLSAYRRARIRWCNGNRRVQFPAGTYLMKHLHRADCASPCIEELLAA